MEATGGFEPPIKVLQTSALATWPCRHICGAQTRIWTTDTGIFSPLLYRLSYLGILTILLASDIKSLLKNSLILNLFWKKSWFLSILIDFVKWIYFIFKEIYWVIMAGVTRFELATSCVTGKHSNQLSYTPIIDISSGEWSKFPLEETVIIKSLKTL